MTDVTDPASAPRASFTDMAESTVEDWQIIMGQRVELEQSLPDRIIEQFGHLRNDYGGFPVDRLEHSLQTATRAERAGGEQLRIVSEHCPFGGAPIEHPVICAVDRGLVRGMLGALYGDAETDLSSSLPMGDDVCITEVTA